MARNDHRGPIAKMLGASEELSAAAERMWNILHEAGQLHNTCGGDMGPYHVQASVTLDAAHQAVPAALRQRARDYGRSSDAYDALRELADEFEAGDL